MKTKKTNRTTMSAKEKINILTPLLDKWNGIIYGEDWIAAQDSMFPDMVYIYSLLGKEGMHGFLLHEISLLCHVYNWTWRIDKDNKQAQKFNKSIVITIY